MIYIIPTRNTDEKPKKSKRFHYIAAISGLPKEDEAKVSVVFEYFHAFLK